MTVVTVRALCPMPGIPDGAVLTAADGPRLRALIAAGRYQLLTEHPDPAPSDPTADAAAGDDRPEPGTRAPRREAGETADPPGRVARPRTGRRR